jgi:hypothetical protein
MHSGPKVPILTNIYVITILIPKQTGEATRTIMILSDMKDIIWLELQICKPADSTDY